MKASDTEKTEELWDLYPDVLKVAAGIIANPDVNWDPDSVAVFALKVVRSCRIVCTHVPTESDVG